jgi:hypothetical protein
MSKTNKNQKLVSITLTMQEIWQETIPKVHRSKKQYQRKPKHKNKGYEQQ